MVVRVLNASGESSGAGALLAEHLEAFSDVTVLAGAEEYPAHRAVLAAHSAEFRDVFLGSAKPRDRVDIVVGGLEESVVRVGWELIYSYCYGVTVPLDTAAVLAALPICRRYRFGGLERVLGDFLGGGVGVENCTRAFAVAWGEGGDGGRDVECVVEGAWRIMKNHFSRVTGWDCVPYVAMVKLLKLNDISVDSEAQVFAAVAAWVAGNGAVDESRVAGLVKLIRFPTMTQGELEACTKSALVAQYPSCRKYIVRGIAARADERRGLFRNVVLEASPVYRPRRMDALTFSDRVTSWSRVENSIHTSARYFAGCLWNLVVEPDGDWVGVYLGCLSEDSDGEVDVELDFSLFLVRHAVGTASKPELVKKEVKGAGFGRSGQRIGFPHMIRPGEIDAPGSRFLLRDTLFVGASLRLRSSRADVIGISADGDDTAESQSSVF